MSLPPIHPRPSPTTELASVKGRPGQEDASAGSGTPFDILLAERGGAAPLPLAAQDFGANGGRDRIAPTVAEMFNEHGFFASAEPLHVQPPGEAASQPTAAAGVEPAFARSAAASARGVPTALRDGGPAQVAPQARADAASLSVATAPSAPVARLDGFGGSSVGRFVASSTGSPAASRAAAQPAPRIAAGIARAATTDAKSAPAVEELFSSRADKPLAARVEEHLRRAGATTVRVDIRASEDGLLVSARTDGLDRAERSRLRAEIEALLVRHGHPPARVTLNGEPAPLRRV